MSNTLSYAAQRSNLTRTLVESLTSKATFCFTVAQRHARRARTRKILRALSEEQLSDAGIDRSLIHMGPEAEVDARLMSTLMSLR
ncbi:DUF1127 domain-containing protein [Ensifer sp. MPMI2T]|nr:DUF1127 domain-containing protein [Ensifer sp. MPMI2T]